MDEDFGWCEAGGREVEFDGGEDRRVKCPNPDCRRPLTLRFKRKPAERRVAWYLPEHRLPDHAQRS